MERSTEKSLELIRLCLVPTIEERRELVLEAAKAVTDWDLTFKLGGDRYITPLVYTRLRDFDLIHLIPKASLEKYKKLYQRIASLNFLRLRRMLAISEDLEARGVRMLFLKGMALIMSGDYPDPGHRMCADVDVLMHVEDKELVREAFQRAENWRELPPLQDRPWEDTKWVDDWGNVIEVHWNLKPLNGVSSQVAEDRMWDQAFFTSYKNKRALIPSPEDRFIQSAVHSTADHPFDSSFIFMTMSDLAHLCAARELDWEGMGQVLVREKMLEHVAIITRASSEITGFKPLETGYRFFCRSYPDLEKKIDGVSGSLVRMLKKPYVFTSKPETFLFARRPLVSRLNMVLAYALKKLTLEDYRFRKIHKNDELKQGVNSIALYRRNLLDRDFRNYLVELFKFYRRIDYEINE